MDYRHCHVAIDKCTYAQTCLSLLSSFRLVHFLSSHPRWPWLRLTTSSGRTIKNSPILSVGDGSGDCQLNSCYLEPKRRKLEEREFLENNSQISFIDFLGVQVVSTGLGLSLDNSLLASTSDSPVLALIDDDIDRELQRQDAEIDAFLKLQALEVVITHMITRLFGKITLILRT
ncbi:uncharacterized protein LOC131147560 [Malania oleifera]|uniref:uncharacterized protein LOC131147560 n=1 Tax=Malania oleifera TaxID=397392 RepID=UPI0025AEBAFA|nr:uncharacterized protein LOC131147560 [Malania oleifera]